MSADEPSASEALTTWERLAAFWDDRAGPEGSDIHRLVIAPSIHRLLALRPRERVLDIGCGNGVLARELERRGASVVACDGSAVFVERAKSYGQLGAIDYRVVDATDEEALSSLGTGSFDAVVACMVLMDLPDIVPLFRAARRLLTEHGRCVFTVLHPCFNNPSTVWLIEEERDLTRRYSLKISDYRQTTAMMRASGEPESHWLFHRPLSVIINTAVAAGFVLDGLDEPLFDPDSETESLWAQWAGLPPVVACRVRPSG